jgi:EAL domain-containing protein (putative c-di-GMP-specific phosphodiesterase class I)
VFSSASIGIALSAPTGGASDDLLRDADLAMYRAKSEGKARYAVFDRGMNAEAMQRLELESDLRRGIERGELRLVYQPIMALDTMRISRIEALVRWERPGQGAVSPAAFIPLAEETGLLVPIGQWVLAEACRQARDWQQQFPAESPVLMSVNLSPRQFQHPSLVRDIARTLVETGLEPRYLQLEITENTVMQDAESARATLHELRALGIKLAIDDFGTGYSSLSYLKRFPFDSLKIDRSFISGLGEAIQDTAIVRGVIALAKSLNLSVTGEGETVEQLEQLRALGCDEGQGYYLDRPLSADVMGERLAARVRAQRGPLSRAG